VWLRYGLEQGQYHFFNEKFYRLFFFPMDVPCLVTPKTTMRECRSFNTDENGVASTQAAAGLDVSLSLRLLQRRDAHYLCKLALVIVSHIKSPVPYEEVYLHLPSRSALFGPAADKKDNPHVQYKKFAALSRR
jgi:hypothetical protein